MKKSVLAVLLGGALLSASAVAHQAGDVLFRLGGVHVDARSHSHTKTAVPVNLEVRNNTQVGVTATYMLSDHFAIELLGATPFEHKIKGSVPALNLNLGNVVSVKHLPPSLYAQAYLFDKDSPVRPYVGAGINYTRFFDAESIHPAVTNLNVKKHSVGPVFNAGVDVKLTDNVSLNAAMWYTKIKTTARFDALDAKHEVDIKLSPLVYFGGITYRF